MDWLALRSRLAQIVKKYQYVFLVLLLGMVLMFLPQKNTATEESAPASTDAAEQGIGSQLETILSKIDGVGAVEVLLTESRGTQTYYQTDEDRTSSSDTGSVRIQTVIITGSNREEYGLIQRIDPPTYLGAVIVCQGGDQASVRLAVMEAVSNVTGIGTDRISVLKMK